MPRRRRLIPLRVVVVALLASLASSGARAGAGIFLSWNDCPLSAASAATLMGSCVNGAQEQLIASLELASPVDSVIALEAVVDVQGAAAVLPPWWDYSTLGCRYGKLIASAAFLGSTACVDFWQGQATFDGPPVYSIPARGRPNQARILISFAVPSSQRLSLAAGTRYYAARLAFQNDSTGACSGCDLAACMLLNSIRLIRVPGAVGGDVLLESPGAIGSNHVTWQSTQADCSQVPVRRVTWGRLKTLYR